MEYMLRVTVISFIILACFFGCGRSRHVAIMKDSYTKEEINFFYQLISNESGNPILKRWEQNIRYYVECIPAKKETEEKIILSVVKEFNSMGLPVRIENMNNKEAANLIIYIDTDKNLGLQPNVNGNTTVFSDNGGIINRAEMRISSERFTNRKSLFYHEFIHALGLTGHTLLCTDDMLFPAGGVTALYVSKQDGIALKILYEKHWPTPYSLKDFEKDFDGDLNYNSEAATRYIRDNNIDVSVLQEIKDHGLIEYDSISAWQPVRGQQRNAGRKLQFPNHIKISCTGALPANIGDTVRAISKALTQITPELTIEYADTIDAFPGIVLNFINNSSFADQTIGARAEFQTYDQRDAKVMNLARLDIFYSNRRSFGTVIGSIVYKILTLKDPQYTIDPFEHSGKDFFQIKKEYAELLKIYYSRDLPLNMTNVQLQKLISELNPPPTKH